MQIWLLQSNLKSNFWYSINIFAFDLDQFYRLRSWSCTISTTNILEIITEILNSISNGISNGIFNFYRVPFYRSRTRSCTFQMWLVMRISKWCTISKTGLYGSLPFNYTGISRVTLTLSNPVILLSKGTEFKLKRTFSFA